MELRPASVNTLDYGSILTISHTFYIELLSLLSQSLLLGYINLKLTWKIVIVFWRIRLKRNSQENKKNG